MYDTPNYPNDPAYDYYLGGDDGTGGSAGDQEPGQGPEPTDLGPPDQPPQVSADSVTDTGTTTTQRPTGYDPNLDPNVLASAQAVNASAGQPYPGDTGAAQGFTVGANGQPGPGSATYNRRLDVTGTGTASDLFPPGTTTPSLPNAGTGGGTAGGGTQLSDADWQRAFQQGMGYYVDKYENKDAFLHNALMGDQAIRGRSAGGPGIDELARMAQVDSDARKVYDAITARPDFYNTTTAANWAGLHDASLAAQAQALGGAGVTGTTGPANYNGRLGAPPGSAGGGGILGNNAATLDWLRSQEVQVPRNPVDARIALVGDTLRNELVSTLAAMGATNFHMSVDDANNLTLNYTSKSGTPEVIAGRNGLGVSLVDYADALKQLQDRLGAQQAAAAAAATANQRTNNYGYNPRGNYGNRPYAPPETPKTPPPPGDTFMGFPLGQGLSQAPQPVNWSGAPPDLVPNAIIPTQWGGYRNQVIRPY